MASATSFSLSPAGIEAFNRDVDFFRERIVLRPQEISNYPELTRRLDCIAMNGMIEADIHGTVNATHIAGNRSQTASAAPAISPATATCRSSWRAVPPRAAALPISCR